MTLYAWMRRKVVRWDDLLWSNRWFPFLHDFRPKTARSKVNKSKLEFIIQTARSAPIIAYFPWVFWYQANKKSFSIQHTIKISKIIANCQKLCESKSLGLNAPKCSPLWEIVSNSNTATGEWLHPRWHHQDIPTVSHQTDPGASLALRIECGRTVWIS